MARDIEENPMRDLRDKVIFITGASRGIGKAIALRAAKDGAKVAVVAKTTEPHPKLPGTIFTAAEEIERAGGQAMAIKTDIRFEDQIQAAVDQVVEAWGGIDILVNNASAIHLAPTLKTPIKRFDLMLDINARGSFICTQKCLPHLQRAENPHVLNLSPPLNMDPRWFRNHVAYTYAKYGMSVWVLGMSEEFRSAGVAFNALWPRTPIATAAVANLLGGDSMLEMSRKPEIVADAAHAILTRDSRSCTGNFFVDEDVLREEGVTDLDRYAVVPGAKLAKDFFLD